MSIPRTFSNILNPGHSTPIFQYIYDPNALTTGGNQIITGAFRAFSTSDISNTSISVSGLSLTVGAVAVTGAPVMTITGALNGGNLIPVYTTGSQIAAITGNVPVSVIGTPNVNVTNGVVPISGAIQGGNLIPLFVTGNVISVVTGIVASSSASMAITGFNSGSALGNVNVRDVFLPVSGVNFSAAVNVNAVAITGAPVVTITGVLATTASVSIAGVLVTGGYIGITGVQSAVNNGGFVGITGSVSGNGLGNLDLTHTYLPISGVNTLNVNNVGGYVGLTGAPVVTITGVLATSTSVTVGNVAITGFSSTIAPLAVSGAFTATVSSVAVTGGNVNVTNNLEWALLSGISGALTANLSGAAYVTGQLTMVYTGTMPVTIANTVTNVAPLNITGIVNTVVTGTVSASVPNPLGVTGVSRDTNLQYNNGTLYTFLPMGGRAVISTGASAPTGYASGAFVMMNFDAGNGGLLTNQGVLDKNFDQVTSFTASTGIVLNSGVSGLAPAFFGTALGNNPSRKGWFIANLSTGALMVNFSTNMPTTGVLNLFLKGASAAWAGDGASYTDSPAVYTGPVSVSGFGGAPCVYNAWQM